MKLVSCVSISYSTDSQTFLTGGALDLLGHWQQLPIRVTILYCTGWQIFLKKFIISMAGFCGSVWELLHYKLKHVHIYTWYHLVLLTFVNFLPTVLTETLMSTDVEPR